MRTTRALALAATAAALALTACSSPGTDATETASADQSAAPAETTDAADGAFPVTVETAFGEVTIDEEPERVVALGWGDAEMALALGVQPVGAADWLAFGGDGVGPWSEGLYDTSPEILGTLELSYEAVAALEPDLILDVRGSGDAERHERLSEIATTVGVPVGGESYLTTNEDHTMLIATALGQPEVGEALLAEVDEAFAAAVAEHPEWDGLTVTAATRTSEGWGAYTEGDVRVAFLEDLGFTQSPTVAELPASAYGFAVDVSAEQLDLLDADLIVAFPIWIESTLITEDAQWNAIPAVADGRSVVIDGDLSNAYSLGVPASQLYAIDALVPLIADALS